MYKIYDILYIIIIFIKIFIYFSLWEIFYFIDKMKTVVIGYCWFDLYNKKKSFC